MVDLIVLCILLLGCFCSFFLGSAFSSSSDRETCTRLCGREYILYVRICRERHGPCRLENYTNQANSGGTGRRLWVSRFSVLGNCYCDQFYGFESGLFELCVVISARKCRAETSPWQLACVRWVMRGFWTRKQRRWSVLVLAFLFTATLELFFGV